jgi:hypothetical protein
MARQVFDLRKTLSPRSRAYRDETLEGSAVGRAHGDGRVRADRLACDACKHTSVELLPWAERYQRETTRLQQHVALQAQSMPTC